MDAKQAVEWLSGHHNDLMKISMVKNTPYGKIATLIQSLQAENAKLRGQVKKMKCCRNCRYWNDQDGAEPCEFCADKSEWKWELKGAE